MAMIPAMAMAGMIAGRNKALISYLEEQLQREHNRFIYQLKSSVRSDYESIQRFKKTRSVLNDDSLQTFQEKMLKSYQDMMGYSVKTLIAQIKEHNKTDEKRKQLQHTLWYSKLSTKQRIMATLGLLKQQKVK